MILSRLTKLGSLGFALAVPNPPHVTPAALVRTLQAEPAFAECPPPRPFRWRAPAAPAWWPSRRKRALPGGAQAASASAPPPALPCRRAPAHFRHVPPGLFQP